MDDLKAREKEIALLSAQAEALERQKLVMRRAVNQVTSQSRQAQVRREVLTEKIAALHHRAEPMVSRRTAPQPLA